MEVSALLVVILATLTIRYLGSDNSTIYGWSKPHVPVLAVVLIVTSVSLQFGLVQFSSLALVTSVLSLWLLAKLFLKPKKLSHQ